LHQRSASMLTALYLHFFFCNGKTRKAIFDDIAFEDEKKGQCVGKTIRFLS